MAKIIIGVVVTSAATFKSIVTTAAVREKNKAVVTALSLINLLGEMIRKTARKRTAIPRYSLARSRSPRMAKEIRGTQTIRKREIIEEAERWLRECIFIKREMLRKFAAPRRIRIIIPLEVGTNWEKKRAGIRNKMLRKTEKIQA